MKGPQNLQTQVTSSSITEGMTKVILLNSHGSRETQVLAKHFQENRWLLKALFVNDNSVSMSAGN